MNYDGACWLIGLMIVTISPGCARFPEFVQNFSERQILWSLCSGVFHALTLKLPIQTSLSVAPKLQVSLSSNEKCENFSKTSTPLCKFSDDLTLYLYTSPFFLVKTCQGITLTHRTWPRPMPRSRSSGHLINIHVPLI